MKIKICGITRPEDGELAARLGADAIGLNFVEASPRFVAPSEAKVILKSVSEFTETVGVFVSPTTTWLDAFGQLTGLQTMQLYAADAMALDQSLHSGGWKVIPAFGVGRQADLDEMVIEILLWQCHVITAILIDAKVSGQHGGTGQPVPWHLLADWQMPYPLILAGGLKPDNVAEAIRIVRPYGVDVASGVESAPGVKDAEKMKRFIGNAREAAAKYMSI